MSLKTQFLGATGTVTGSKYLVTAGKSRVLVDCGLFQGLKHLRRRNWAPLPVQPEAISSVVLTHAHLDHSGYLPVLWKSGFRGPVYCTPATRDLCRILLPDAAHLAEEEAEYANKKRYSKHHPALPLFTKQDAAGALELFRPVRPGEDFELKGGVGLRFTLNGHILGSSVVRLSDGRISILFSGDLGRPNDPVMIAPPRGLQTDYLVVESTYGNRLHAEENPREELRRIIGRTVGNGGVVVIPSFAVGRAQLVLHHIWELKRSGEFPKVPVYMNSPMATDASELYLKYIDGHRLTAEDCRACFRTARYVNSPEESKALNARSRPMIIISASGMATGGRVLHHIARFGPEPGNTILFVGYQAAGTRGARLLDGEREIKIHGKMVPIRARVEYLGGLSAHADYSETLDWLRTFGKPPKRTFVTHGEPAQADALRFRIQSLLEWPCEMPEYLEELPLP